MVSRRTLKAAEVIREVVASAILFEIQDPRVKTDKVTVTRVEVSGDMRYAKVYVSVMASDKNQATCLQGLQASRGFLQAKLAKRIDTRYTPQLTFYLDQGIKHSLKIAKMLDEVLPRDRDANANVDDETEQEHEA
ncbi:MAG: 30S ribosome-binding factor RbfA [Thermoguttaceae bacterium]